jgi:sulfite exporter TauE/SafE
VSFDFLFGPVEHLDAWLTGLLDRAPLIVVLAIAFVLGLRHALDPDHLVAVSSLVAAERGDTRQARRLGGWWGLGHAATLLATGLPLIALRSSLPAFVERGAETVVGFAIMALSLRVGVQWAVGGYRPSERRHDHEPRDAQRARKVHLGRSSEAHGHRHLRTPPQALLLGALHGLAGTGAVVLLLAAALPTRVEAVAAVAVFAPMSAASMALWTTAFAWVLSRPGIEPLYRAFLIPALGTFGLAFGFWYAGLT